LSAESCRFDEPVLQHLLVNANCKPCLLYGAEVIEWNKSDLGSIIYSVNTAMCKIYKVNFQSINTVYQFTRQRDQRSNTCVSNFYVNVFFTEYSIIKLLYECFWAS